MMARTQITLQPEVQRRARQRAGDLGVSFAEYVRRLVVRDLGDSSQKADPALVFDLGKSTRSDIAKDKDPMIAEAFAATGAGRHAKVARLEDSPLILLAIEHDGPGDPLKKQPKRAAKPPRD